MLLGEFVPPSEMSPAACFWWAGRLAAAAAKTPAWLADVAIRLDLESSRSLDATAWLAATEILVDWPQRLDAFLEAFQRIDKHKTTSTGVGRRFGTLLRHAARLEDQGHTAPAEVLRQYLLERYSRLDPVSGRNRSPIACRWYSSLSTPDQGAGEHVREERTGLTRIMSRLDSFYV